MSLGALVLVLVPLSRNSKKTMNLRIWGLFNLPSLAYILFAAMLSITTFGASSFPTVIASRFEYANKTYFPVSQGPNITVCERESGIARVASQASFDAITECRSASDDAVRGFELLYLASGHRHLRARKRQAS